MRKLKSYELLQLADIELMTIIARMKQYQEDYPHDIIHTTKWETAINELIKVKRFVNQSADAETYYCLIE